MRIALLSDIHYGYFSRTTDFSVPGEPVQDASTGGHSLQDELKELLKENEVDYLFIAGDLTSKGSPQEFYYCEKKIVEIAEFANVPIENIIYSVGNHDVDRNISSIATNLITENTEIEVKCILENQYQNISAHVAELNLKSMVKPERGIVTSSGIVESSDFVAFVLNTSIECSQNQKFPHGKITKEQLDWFEKISKDYIDDDRVKIILMHHHPVNYKYHIPALDISLIEEGSELMSIAGKNGIDIIMHGHRHHPTAVTKMEDEWKHPIAFVCAGSLSVNAKHRDSGEIPNTVHIVDIEKTTKRIILYNFQFTSAEGWKSVEKRTATVPLDKEMWLGRITTEEEIEDELNKYNDDILMLKWSELPDVLKYVSSETLTEKVKEKFSSHFVSGEFPNDVIIIPKSEIEL